MACQSDPACAFHGRHLAFDRIFISQGGNQCALITSTFSPCAMEIAGDRPYWRACGRNPEVNGSYQGQLAHRAEPSIEDQARAESYAPSTGLPFGPGAPWGQRYAPLDPPCLTHVAGECDGSEPACRRADA